MHLSRGNLNGVITHPVFDGLYNLYRFRLWNAGQAFEWDHMRDIFAQTASANMNVPFSDNAIATKFINGEFWGFTIIREHTSNAHFVHTRLGIDINNVAMLSGTWQLPDPSAAPNVVSEGDEVIVKELYRQLVDFVTMHDLSTDYARKRLFDEFFCQYNFVDYLIANTFFNNHDWIPNNTRFFRAIEPDYSSSNPYNDGRWRFILHDMDRAPRPIEIEPGHYLTNRFPALFTAPASIEGGNGFSHIYTVLNNPTFSEEFRSRALYVLDNYYHADVLLKLHDDFTGALMPLLPEMYNRFAIRGNIEESLYNFHQHNQQLRNWILAREHHYRIHLDELVARAIMGNSDHFYISTSIYNSTNQHAFAGEDIDPINFRIGPRAYERVIILGYRIYHNDILIRDSSDFWAFWPIGAQDIRFVIVNAQTSDAGRYDTVLHYIAYVDGIWQDREMQLPAVNLFIEERVLPFTVDFAVSFEDVHVNTGQEVRLIDLVINPIGGRESEALLFAYGIQHNDTRIVEHRISHTATTDGAGQHVVFTIPSASHSDSGEYLLRIWYLEPEGDSWTIRIIEYGVVRLDVD